MTLTQTQTTTVGSIALRAHPTPLQRNGALDKYDHFEVTPVIGTEYNGVQLSQLLDAPDKNTLLKDLAVQGEPDRGLSDT